MNGIRRKNYRLRTFIWDFFMFAITGGLWLLYVIFREIKMHS